MMENEVVFRQRNEKVKQTFDEIVEQAKESNQEYLIHTDDTALHFYCECSDENCRRRIQIQPSLYHRIHKNRRCFVLIPGHETNLIERIISNTDTYNIVEKFNTPSESARILSPTNIDNS
jgi:hypothetical protein